MVFYPPRSLSQIWAGLLVGTATVHADRPPSEGRTANGFIAALINEVVTNLTLVIFIFI